MHTAVQIRGAIPSISSSGTHFEAHARYTFGPPPPTAPSLLNPLDTNIFIYQKKRQILTIVLNLDFGVEKIITTYSSVDAAGHAVLDTAG